MAQGIFPLYSLNGGEVSRLALTRLDLSRMTISAERVENFFISTLGWIGLRPGTADLGGTKGNQKTQLVRFVGTTSTCSLLELTANVLRVRNDGALVTRNAVTSAITNGSFAGNTTGWTTSVASGGAVVGVGPHATIKGSGLVRSYLRQAITIPGGSAGVEHGLRITVPKGPVYFRVGTASGLDDIVSEKTLSTGTYSLAVVLAGTIYIEFSAADLAPRQVGPVAFEAAGIMEIPTIWGASDIGFVRYDQQGDVVFCANRNYRQKRIESLSRRSWGVVDYIAKKGPFLATPDTPASITPSARSGSITLTASRPTFNAQQVGALWELTHPGQNPSATLTGADQYTAPIRVTGTGTSMRKFNISIAGTWSGTITLQQAAGSPDGWQDRKTYTTNQNVDFDDNYGNSVIYYRLGFKVGDFSSGSAVASLTYTGGSTIGVVTVTGFTSPTVLSADVVESIGDVTGTSSWREAMWSDFRGWPRSEKFQDGRLIWLGKNYLFGSVSDDYPNFDDTIDGDSAPVIRSIATGPVDGNIWIMRLYRLFVASATAITGIRSSSLDEPITATAFTARDIDELGAADVAPVSVAGRGIYVGRSGIDLFEIVGNGGVGDYAVNSLTRMNPEIAEIGIVMIAAQRRPEPRIWCVLADGTMALVTYNRDENVVAWQRWTTSGFVENVEVLPNLVQDDVYVVVQRVFGGSMVRRVELCSYENDTRGGTTHRAADSGRLVTSGSPATTFTIPDFAGLPVVVWTAEKKAYSLAASGTGAIVLPAATTSAWIGLGYTGKFQSTKLAYASQNGTALNQKKRVDHLGLNFDTTVRAGVSFGPSFDRLDPLPLMVKGREVDPTLVEQDIDDVPIPFNGTWDTDSRFCIQASAPYPCRVKAAVIGITTHDAR